MLFARRPLRAPDRFPPVNRQSEIYNLEWSLAGLLLPSVVRLHKVATLQRKLVDRKLGGLTPGDWSRVVLTLRQTCRSL